MKMGKFVIAILVAFCVLFGAPHMAFADTDTRLAEVLAVNPGLTIEELEASISQAASQNNQSRDEIISQLYEDSANARAVQNTSGMSVMSSGGDGEGGVAVKLGCAAAGYYTYSYATNYNVRHGHNTLFTGACKAVHMPGGSISNIREISSTYTGLRTHTSYPAHLRRINGASVNMNDRAGAFGVNRLKANVQYNSNFAINKSDIWQTHYNCSSLVWAAWMYASTSNVDLDYTGGLGVYPEDLWKSPLTVLSRYLVKA